MEVYLGIYTVFNDNKRAVFWFGGDFNVSDIERRVFSIMGDTSISALYIILRSYSTTALQELRLTL